MNDPYSYKEIHPLWSLVDPLSGGDAAALIAGFDPNSIDGTRQFFRNRETNLTDSDGITWVYKAQTALENAILAKHLKATIRRSAWERVWDEEPEDGEAYAQKVTIRPNDASEAWGRLDRLHALAGLLSHEEVAAQFAGLELRKQVAIFGLFEDALADARAALTG